MRETEPSSEDSVAFITRSAVNNGVGAYVLRNEKVPFPKGSITIALGGSLGSTFLQQEDFYTGQNVAVLLAKKDVPLTVNQKLFFASMIRKETELRYVAFGRELNKHVKTDFSIGLPVDKNDKPDLQWIENFMKSIKVKLPMTKNKAKVKKVDTNTWKSFRIGDLFHLETGKAKDELALEGDGCVYLGAKKLNNCVMKTCLPNTSLEHKGNCIVFICNGEGSAGFANYMDKPFIASTDLVMGYNPKLNSHIGMFLVTVIDLERPKYSFGRKWKNTLAKTTIKLPTTPEGSPNWKYMENFIKSLPYGDCL